MDPRRLRVPYPADSEGLAVTTSYCVLCGVLGLGYEWDNGHVEGSCLSGVDPHQLMQLLVIDKATIPGEWMCKEGNH